MEGAQWIILQAIEALGGGARISCRIAGVHSYNRETITVAYATLYKKSLQENDKPVRTHKANSFTRFAHKINNGKLVSRRHATYAAVSVRALKFHARYSTDYRLGKTCARGGMKAIQTPKLQSTVSSITVDKKNVAGSVCAISARHFH